MQKKEPAPLSKQDIQDIAGLEVDYKVERTRVTQGRMAPKGFFFLIVRVKGKGMKYIGTKQVPIGIDEETEQMTIALLRKDIQDKYKI